MSEPCPLIDERPYDQVVEKTEQLAKEFSGWTGEGGMDAGGALIRVFARMAQHVIERINRIPERSFAAFLDRIGVSPSPPTAARVPLSFTLVEQGEDEPVIPAGTRVGAEAKPGDTREVVFETEMDLPTTRAKLVSVFSSHPDGERNADRTDQATGKTPGYFDAFDGGAGTAAFYVAIDDVLDHPAGTEVFFSLSGWKEGISSGWYAWMLLHYRWDTPPGHDCQERSLHPPFVQWTYWNGTSWAPLELSFYMEFISGFYTPADIMPSVVAGHTACWLRAQVLAWPSPDPIAIFEHIFPSERVLCACVRATLLTWPEITIPEEFQTSPEDVAQLRAKVRDNVINLVLPWPKNSIPRLTDLRLRTTILRQHISPEAALSGGWPVDMATEFQPFGQEPRLQDMFYIACDEALARPGKLVTVDIQISENALHLSKDDKPVLSWEISTQAGWTQLTTTTPSSSTDPIPNDALRSISLTIPKDVAPTTVAGKEACWLRIRIAGGNYGRGIYYEVQPDGKLLTKNDGYRPPILTSVGFTYHGERLTDAPLCITQSGRFFLEQDPHSTFPILLRVPDQQPALYMGFDRKLSSSDTLLYIQIAQLRPEEALRGVTAWPSVVWEYAQGSDGWKTLACQDDTRSFAMTGCVRFTALRDHAARALFGQELFWIRARLDLPAEPLTEPLIPRRLGRILTNTVWASHAAVFTAEILGSSDGCVGQIFQCSQRPVLAGQRIEVCEAMPLPAECAEIERLEGPDAITPGGIAERPSDVWIRWHEVPDFYASKPRDRHYVMDHMSGQIRFGDGLHGMVPPKGVRNVRAAHYRAGGGVDGNRPLASITQLKTSIPGIEKATNLEASSGGANREGMERVKERGPRILRHGHRAVAAQDFEDLAREASPAVAKARAITPLFDPILTAEEPNHLPDDSTHPLPGGVILLIATAGPELPPAPSMALLRDVEAYVRARQASAVSLRISGPIWIEVCIKGVRVVSSSTEGMELLRSRIGQSIDAFLHPITGGTDGSGWDFGQLPRASDIYRLLLAIPGVARVGPLAIEYSSQSPSAENTLIYPGTHEIQVSALEGV